MGTQSRAVYSTQPSAKRRGNALNGLRRATSRNQAVMFDERQHPTRACCIIGAHFLVRSRRVGDVALAKRVDAPALCGRRRGCVACCGVREALSRRWLSVDHLEAVCPLLSDGNGFGLLHPDQTNHYFWTRAANPACVYVSAIGLIICTPFGCHGRRADAATPTPSYLWEHCCTDLSRWGSLNILPVALSIHLNCAYLEIRSRLYARVREIRSR